MSQVIMDIGAHNGDDTAYYLHRGFRVISVEANPVLACELRKRFVGQPVIIENVCIAPSDERSVTFWVNESNSTWSAFDRALASRAGTLAYPVEVPAVTMGSLLKRYGVPHYLKIDIEGMDQECLRSMDRANLPRYISLELSHEEDIIGGLAALGYTRFKVINQGTWTNSLPIFSREYGWRLLRKLRAGALVPDGIKMDFDRFVSQNGWEFNKGASGPFGEETFGKWLTPDEAKHLHERIERAYIENGEPIETCWHDIHATY